MFKFFQKKFLKIFVFHALFSNSEEASKELLDVSPERVVTVNDFRKFVESQLAAGYVFISPSALFKNEWSANKHAFITFDDGYYNNVLALPILQEYKIPAIFFISTANVLEKKSFWWDILFRERRGRGTAREAIIKERQELKKKTHAEIENYITNVFGRRAFQPLSDTERPFTQEELRDFSQNKFVYLGNHTRHHAILTNYSRSGIYEEILEGGADLGKITGMTPKILAYPNGNVSEEIIEIARETGIEIGMTVQPTKVNLPLDRNHFLLGRFPAIP